MKPHTQKFHDVSNGGSARSSHCSSGGFLMRCGTSDSGAWSDELGVWRLGSGRARMQLEPLLKTRAVETFLWPVDGPPRLSRSRPDTGNTAGRHTSMDDIGDDIVMPLLKDPHAHFQTELLPRPQAPPSSRPSTVGRARRRGMRFEADSRSPRGNEMRTMQESNWSCRSDLSSTTTSIASISGISSAGRAKGVQTSREKWTLCESEQRWPVDNVQSSVAEIMHLYSAMPNGVYRGIQEKAALEELADEQVAVSQYRLDSQRVAQDDDRRQAATWRERHERERQISELHWVLQDPRFEKLLTHRGRLVSTPIAGEEKDLEQRGVSTAEEGGFRVNDDARDDTASTPKTKKPLHMRLRAIRRRTKDAYRKTKLHAEEKKQVAKASEGEVCHEDSADEQGQPKDKQQDDKQAPLMGLTKSLKSMMKHKVDDVKRLDEVAHETAADKENEAKELKTQVNLKWHRASIINKVQKANRALSSVQKFQNKESMTMLSVFAKHDEDKSETLDQGEMLACLRDLGLRWRTEEERKTIRRIIWEIDELQISFDEFSHDVLPKVRSQLGELRRPRLEALFHEVDAYETGMVSIEEALEALRRHAIFASTDVCKEALLAHTHMSGRSALPAGFKKSVVDVDGFVSFVNALQERTERDAVVQFQSIAQRYVLTAQEQEHWKYDLVNLHKMFHEYDPCSGKYGSPSGFLNEAQVIKVVRESGYMPKTRMKQMSVGAMVNELKGPDATVNFRMFLKIISTLRENDRERLRKAFDTRCGIANGTLSRIEVYHLLEDCGCMPRTSEEKAELDAIFEDIDDEGSGRMVCEEFVTLFQRMAARMRIMQREKERQYVLSAGWTENHFGDFHNAFQVFDEDMSEILERDELMKAVELLKGQYWQSSGNMNLMLVALGIDPTKEIKVNFLTFLRMLKMLDESESRRQQGALIGYQRDRTDKLFSVYQALDQETIHSGLRRDVLENALIVACRHFKGAQLQECRSLLHNEPVQVEFTGFLRILKMVEALIENDFEDFLSDILHWEDIVAKEGDQVLSDVRNGQNRASVRMVKSAPLDADPLGDHHIIASESASRSA